MLKKENETLLKDNKEMNIIIESLNKIKGDDDNKAFNELKRSVDTYKEKENSLSLELKNLRIQYETVKKEVENEKKDGDAIKMKLEIKNTEVSGLKDDIKIMKNTLYQVKLKIIIQIIIIKI